jgi:tetratricopeptide (TPR) repeat protein
MYRNGASLTTAMGDSFYQAQMFNTAYLHFSKAISISKKANHKNNKNLQILYAKRSLSLLKMKEFKKCFEDIQCALKEMPEESEIDSGLKVLRSKLIPAVFMDSDTNEVKIGI